MKVKTHTVDGRHRAFFDDVMVLFRKHAARGLSAEEMLALSAHITGKLLAMQDHRTMTTERAMEIITLNIERGNQEAIEQHGKGLWS